MSTTHKLVLVAGAFVALCGVLTRHSLAKDEPSKDIEKEIAAALATLPAADKSLAESQRFCPVSDERLGEMGAPIKIAVNGESVFICCDDCKAKALADAKGTLAKVEKMKKINATLAKLSAADRKLAEEQKFCAIQTKNELGTMGAPIKLTLDGETVFLCCNSCKAKATANPKDAIASAKKLRAEHTPEKH